MSLRDEIFEQPEAIRRLLEMQAQPVREVAARIRDKNPPFVYLAARGTSDNAGLYAKYLWGISNGLPVALAAPSMFSVFEKPPKIGDSLVVGISQSGQSPDIVSVIEEGRRQGALTLAITNDSQSPLAEAAELVIDTVAGPEEAVAATKTYTTQLTAIAMLSVALTGDAEQSEWLGRLPSLVEDTLELDETIKEASSRYRYMDECVVLGRGFNYATAYEWSLKLKELAYVIAEPYSSADFQHGPVALARQGLKGRAARHLQRGLGPGPRQHTRAASGTAPRVDHPDPGHRARPALLLSPDPGQGLQHGGAEGAVEGDVDVVGQGHR
jgi:glucosamine--fructose-6-phosphate aminotransferase (isomerizing)